MSSDTEAKAAALVAWRAAKAVETAAWAKLVDPSEGQWAGGVAALKARWGAAKAVETAAWNAWWDEVLRVAKGVSR